MPPAKRVKSSADSRPNAESSKRPTVEDLEGENEFASLARQHWLKATSKQTSKAKTKAQVKVKNDVLKREIWDILEKENFPIRSLLVLEGLQTLERSVTVQALCMLVEIVTNILQLLMARIWGGFIQLPCPLNHSDS